MNEPCKNCGGKIGVKEPGDEAVKFGVIVSMARPNHKWGQWIEALFFGFCSSRCTSEFFGRDGAKKEMDEIRATWK